jgi:hypothetical protein
MVDRRPPLIDRIPGGVRHGRRLLVALGLSEILTGGGAAVMTVILMTGPAAQEGAPFLLLLLPYVLLVPSGGALFAFRPWAYRLHLLLVPIALVGGPLWFSTEVGILEMLPQVFAGLMAALVLTRMFFSRSVRRMFGISPPAAGDLRP